LGGVLALIEAAPWCVFYPAGSPFRWGVFTPSFCGFSGFSAFFANTNAALKSRDALGQK
jgi:hypothetical protein